jgi:hypothetical protein
MRKQTVEFDSRLDALLALAKRLSRHEAKIGMDSEAFYDSYSKGDLGDDAQFIEWANDYRHYLALRSELDKKLHEAA